MNCKVWLLSLTISTTIPKYFKLWCHNFPSQGISDVYTEIAETMQPQAECCCQFNRTRLTLWVHNGGSFPRWFPGDYDENSSLLRNSCEDGWFHFLSDDLRATRSDSELLQTKAFSSPLRLVFKNFTLASYEVRFLSLDYSIRIHAYFNCCRGIKYEMIGNFLSMRPPIRCQMCKSYVSWTDQWSGGHLMFDNRFANMLLFRLRYASTTSITSYESSLE